MVKEILTRLGGHKCDVVIGSQLHVQRFYSGFGFFRRQPYDGLFAA
jgi:predicted GNAT family N-acyltransferase